MGLVTKLEHRSFPCRPLPAADLKEYLGRAARKPPYRLINDPKPGTKKNQPHLKAARNELDEPQLKFSQDVAPTGAYNLILVPAREISMK